MVKENSDKRNKKVETAGNAGGAVSETAGTGGVADQSQGQPPVAAGLQQEAQPPLPPTPAAAPEARIRELETMLVQAEDKYLRARAEMDNYRRRVQRELADSRTAATADTMAQMLGVFDHFQMAVQHAEQASDVAALRDGMRLILGEFERALENLGVVKFSALGQVFDPNQHAAVSQEPSAEVAAGLVLKEWKCGYRLGERLLRPATVVVSAGAPG